MKEKIVASNKYKRYNFYLILYGVIYALIVLIHLLTALFYSLDPEQTVNPWMIYGLPIILYSIVFLPFILFYGTKLIYFRLNVENFKIMTGTITSIETSQFLRSDHRDVKIKITEINKSFYSKVYKGSLYDEVAKGINVEVAYNEYNDDIVILNVI